MKEVELPEIKQPSLPSHHQIGDYVHVVVSKAASEADEESILYNGKVIKVHFGPGKVTYDLEFTVTVNNANKKRYVTRIHNVDGALCCSLEEYKSSKKQDDSPFNHGGWHNHDKHPSPNYKEWIDDGEPTYSADVLIDLDGNRKTFRVGWYDYEYKKWYYYHEENDMEAIDASMKWANLPLA